MKNRKFESVQLHQEVRFEENGQIETGVVCSVTDNTFTVRALRFWDNNGVKSFYDAYFNFHKTGTKSNQRYTYGNAVSMGNILS